MIWHQDCYFHPEQIVKYKDNIPTYWTIEFTDPEVISNNTIFFLSSGIPNIFPSLSEKNGVT